MIRLCLTLASVLLLVACGTPQEQCIRKATSQTRMLNRLIAESQTNLARGYTYRTEERHHFRWMACGPIQPSGGATMCFEPEDYTVEVPVAIDPIAEQNKLDGLLAKRAGLQKQDEAAVASCRATYPE